MADLPPLDTPPRGLGFDDEFGFDDEADVQIITTDDELGGAASQQGRFHDPQRLPLPDHPHDQSSNWTPDHLARRLDRLDGSAEDTLTALARYSGEVEEASVEIVRKPKPSTVEPEPSTLATNSAPSDLPPAAGLASPAPEQTKQSDRPMPPREQVGTPAKRRSRRFLSALIGGDRDS